MHRDGRFVPLAGIRSYLITSSARAKRDGPQNKIA
jgi:hypothetical protein